MRKYYADKRSCFSASKKTHILDAPFYFRAFLAIGMNPFINFRNDVAFYPAMLFEGEDRDVHG